MKNSFDIDLIIYSLGRGGAERVCITFANELSNRNYNVRIVTLYNAKNNYLSDLNKNVNYCCLNAKNYLSGLILLKKLLIKVIV